MLESIPKPELYRTTQQVGELQVQLELIVQRILRRIDETQTKIDSTKAEISNRWKTSSGLTQAERNRIAQHETASRTREIINDLSGLLDIELKNAYAVYQEIEGTKAFYPNKMQFLMNSTLGTTERARYATIIASAGPMELMGYAMHAVATQDASLGAAVLQTNDALPGKSRRFASVEIVSRIALSAWDSLQKAFKYSDTQFQQAVIAIRTFKASKPSPLSTIHLAMLEGKTDMGDDPESLDA